LTYELNLGADAHDLRNGLSPRLAGTASAAGQHAPALNRQGGGISLEKLSLFIFARGVDGWSATLYTRGVGRDLTCWLAAASPFCSRLCRLFHVEHRAPRPSRQSRPSPWRSQCKASSLPTRLSV
jgi:hypothetical protein